MQDARQFGGLGKLGTPHGNLKKLTVDDRSGMGPKDDVKKFSSNWHMQISCLTEHSRDAA